MAYAPAPNEMELARPPTPSPRKERRILIALCGVTGAGKTTFVAKASGRKDLEIGYGVDPCESSHFN